GMINPSSAESFENILPNRWLRKGIIVNRKDGNVSIDLYIVAEHGTNISAICENLKERVVYVSKKYAAIKLSDVNIHVKGIVLK
ncbi:MAG: Asp23/Gls24 family envelope stress response protein, partial [Eggerthellaceae bacterium]|nr:Asp23/Gls24 family envelope stress response protein [Eggerthellaceae bacterium]